MIDDDADPPRSNRAEVRNPVLALPSARRLEALPPEAREALCDLLEEMRVDAYARADRAWRRSRPPVAAYWRAVSTYAGHVRKALRRLAREAA